MDKDIERVLDCLNKNKIRATYGAVREYLGLNIRPNWGELLGAKSPYSSWIVRKSDGYPSRYSLEEMHSDLESNPEIITESEKLKELLNETTT